MKYIHFFHNISKSDVSRFGGKAASLGEMAQSQFPIPDGFALSVDAFREFNGKEFSAEFEKELHDAYTKLGASRVAVRSSAVAEDASGASWAGQLETYLNVARDNLHTSIRKCWKSILSDEAVAYAVGKKLTEADLAVGVVVQTMIESEVSGVMFTANPITSDRSQVVIEGVFGLGEMIVQGIVTPDNWLISKDPLTVEEFNIAIKSKEMIFNSGKNSIRAVPEGRNDRATLREEQVLELARIGLKIEKHYKVPQDIEWAWAGGKFYIIQARPVTTLS